MVARPSHQRTVRSARDGCYVRVPAEALRILRLDFQWWLQWLASHLELTGSGNPVALVQELAWDIGDLWLDRRRKLPVVFVRRLRSIQSLRSVNSALEARSGRANGVLLSASSKLDASYSVSQNFRITPIRHCLSSDGARFSLDRATLAGVWSGPQPSADIVLSPDGSILTIRGERVFITGKTYAKIVRKLVNAHIEGVRLRTADVLGEVAAHSFASHFGKSPMWPALKKILRQERGFCWLEP
jgi:hypothetical protein